MDCASTSSIDSGALNGKLLFSAWNVSRTGRTSAAGSPAVRIARFMYGSVDCVKG